MRAVQTVEQGRIEVPCINDDADKIRSKSYETVFKLRIFFWVHTATLFTLRTLGAQINWRIISRKVLFDPHRFCQTNRLFILPERAETEICISMANSMFKTKMDIDRHGPRLTPINCQHLNPPYFSLPTTVPVKLPHLVSGLWPVVWCVVWGALVNFPYSSLFLALFFHTCKQK
jgi:hypothetical protein